MWHIMRPNGSTFAVYGLKRLDDRYWIASGVFEVDRDGTGYMNWRPLNGRGYLFSHAEFFAYGFEPV